MIEGVRDEAFERWEDELDQQGKHVRGAEGMLARLAWDACWAHRQDEVRRLWETVKAPPDSTTHAILRLLAATFRQRVDLERDNRDKMAAAGDAETALYHQGRCDAFRAAANQLEHVLGGHSKG